MAYGNDITEGIPYVLSNPAGATAYTATGYAYDIAIAGQPFFISPLDDSPYRRVTAKYRKDQFDTSREPGEQTLTGWWLRSQSSFHFGQGIKFYEPAQDESLRFQYTASKGMNVWEKGQATLLKSCTTTHLTTGAIRSNGRPWQIARSIKWNSTNGILLMDEYDVDKIAADGTLTHFIDYNTGTDYPVHAICDDGVYAYWVTNVLTSGTPRLRVYKKLLTADSTVSPTLMFSENTITVTNAVMEYTKERIIMAVNDKIYEFATSATALPTAVYAHNDPDHIFTSITSSGAAIYVAGYSGIQSNIYKFTLETTGAMPTLTSAITAAELPVGERCFKVSYYLGYMAIGTDQGVRIAQVSDQDGSIAYGPLLFESTQPVYDFAFRDKYIWATTGVEGQAGVTRIDLGTEISSLVFAYAWDLYDPDDDILHNTTTCSFLGETDRLSFVTAGDGVDGKIYLESASTLLAEGYLQTGFVRYNTLELKIFKLLQARVNTLNGGVAINTVNKEGADVRIGTFAQGSEVPEININYPIGSQEYLGFKFIFTRSTMDSTQGPLFTGYQVKALPAIPRQRLIQYPVMCYDHEMDKFNNEVGYEGSAYDRMSALETVENIGDTIRVEDFRTGESFIGLIEEMDFINRTPTDKRFSGYGGVLLVTIRSV
jgi:hypothetical protein